jgi:hypothetical protein
MTKTKTIAFLCSTVLAALLFALPAQAGRNVRFGVQDDAWLAYGAGTLDERLDTLEKLGVDVVRYTIRWDQVAKRRPASPRRSADPAYDWDPADGVLRGLRARGIGVVLTLAGSPRWANGGRQFRYPPLRGRDFADFAVATAQRYPWVRLWTIWNEPNKLLWFRPQSPRLYVQRLLNPAHAALKAVNRSNRVAGGVTAPRGGSGGTSPVDWIRGMGRYRARLDAYAHNPYATNAKRETPSSGGCAHCETLTMATLDRLVSEVRRAFGTKRLWLTEYAYQTTPDRTILSVSRSTAARYMSEAAYRVHASPYVDLLIHFLIRDDTARGGWQSGFFTAAGTAKPTYHAWRFPLTQASRQGTRTHLWGQVKPRTGRQPYRLRQLRGGRWVWIGGTRWTNSRGVFARTVSARRGTRFQIYSPRDRGYGFVWTVR